MDYLMKNKTITYLSGRLFDGISSGLFMMALPWVMLQQPNMGTFVALIALFCTGLSFCLTPLFSVLIDKHSRKNILILVQVIQSLTAAIICVTYWLGIQSNGLLALAQIVFWVSSNVAWASNNAFTQENYAKDEYAKISGYQEIVMQGTTLGSGALGILLLEQWGMVEFALFAAVASFLAALSYLITPYHRQVSTPATRSFLGQIKESKIIITEQPTFYGFILISCLSYPVLTFLSKLVPIWFARLGVSGDWFAMYNVAFGLGSLMTGLVISKILALYSQQSIMQYSVLVLSIILLAMSSVIQPLYIVIFTAFFGLFNALNRIARTNWMHHEVPMEQRGRIDGGLAMFSTLAQSLSYVLIAFLAHTDNVGLGFVIVGFIMFLASLGMLKLGSTLDKNQKLAASH